MDHLDLLTLLENSPMKYLSPSFGMVSGLHVVLTFAWCVIIRLIIHLTDNHGSAKSVICLIVLSVHHATRIPNHLMIPHATPTSNSLHHHLFVLPVLLHLYHFAI